MSVDGIWTGEVYGPFGWDNRGVFLIENGRVVGGDNRQYSTGSYELVGTSFKAELTVHYYGPPRTQYGEAREQFRTELTGEVIDGVIQGSVGRPDRPDFDLQIRLTKRLDLPAG